MTVFKCTKCGKEISVNKMNEIENIKCGHCNKEYTIDKKTNRKVLIFGVIFIFLAAFIAVLISELFKISTLVTILPMVILGFFGKNIVLKFLAKLNQVSYTDK